MLTATEIAGFAGAGLAGAAYVPQISHIIRARCSAGISRLAFEAWLLASVLTTAQAIAIHAGVFILLGGIQIVATALIMLFAARYKDTPCPSHLPRPPRAKTATRTGSSGNEPGPWRPADLASPRQGDAVRDGSLLANFSSALPTCPRTAGFPRPALGVPGSAARAHAAERCANAAVHTFGRAPELQATYLRGTR
jgi:hypothetical protein